VAGCSTTLRVFRAFKSLTFASPRLLPLALYLLSRESTPPIDRRGEALLENSPPVDVAKAVVVRPTFTSTPLSPDRSWWSCAISSPLSSTSSSSRQFSRSEVPDDSYGTTLLAIDLNGYNTSERRERERSCEIIVVRPVSSSVPGKRIREADVALRFHPPTMIACIARISRIRIQ